jgi:hypothetical protein
MTFLALSTTPYSYPSLAFAKFAKKVEIFSKFLPRLKEYGGTVMTEKIRFNRVIIVGDQPSAEELRRLLIVLKQL